MHIPLAHFKGLFLILICKIYCTFKFYSREKSRRLWPRLSLEVSEHLAPLAVEGGHPLHGVTAVLQGFTFS
jgi:hypothetical protein